VRFDDGDYSAGLDSAGSFKAESRLAGDKTGKKNKEITRKRKFREEGLVSSSWRRKNRRHGRFDQLRWHFECFLLWKGLEEGEKEVNATDTFMH